MGALRERGLIYYAVHDGRNVTIDRLLPEGRSQFVGVLGQYARKRVNLLRCSCGSNLTTDYFFC
jgi:hypothetical protein